MTKILLLFSFFAYCLVAHAQWTEKNFENPSKLYDVVYQSKDIIKIVGFNGMFNSYDGGVTWDSIMFQHNNGVEYYSSIPTDIKFINENIGFATGNFFTGNSYAIVKTENGGKSWRVVYFYGFGTWPRVMSEIDHIGNTFMAVGKSGKIVKSINSGESWSDLPALENYILHSVCMIDKNTIFTSGRDAIYKSTNGGYTWEKHSIPDTEINAIRFYNENIGYAAGEKYIFKTTNAGDTWNAVFHNPKSCYKDIAITPNGRIFISGEQSVISSLDGVIWEEEILPNNYNYVASDFLNDSNGILISQKIHITNSGGLRRPIVSFTSKDTIFCKDSVYTFETSPTKASNYQWTIDGTNVGSDESLNYAFLEGDKTYKVKFIASNNGYSDTITQNVYVQPSLEIDLNVSYSDEQLCPGYNLDFTVENSKENIWYVLKKENNQISGYRKGNGDTLIFNSGPVFSSSNYSIVASTTNKCGNNVKIQHLSIKTLSSLAKVDWYQTQGLEMQGFQSISAITDKIVFVAGDGKAFKSTNGGKIFTEISQDILYEKGHGRNNLYHVDFIDENNGVMTGFNDIVKTTNGGSTITDITPYFGYFNFSWLGVKMISHDTIIAYGASRNYLETFTFSIVKSTDGGQTWQKLKEAQLHKDTFIGELFIASNKCYYMPFYDNYTSSSAGDEFFYKTTDGGENWDSIVTPSKAGFEKIHFITEDIGYALGKYEILKTTNGGLNWTSQSLITRNGDKPWFNSIYFTDLNTGYATGSGRVWKTINAGECWQQVSDLVGSQNDIEFTNDGKTGYIVGEYGITSPAIFWRTSMVDKWAKFHLTDSIVCLGTDIRPINDSNDFDNYKWFVNETLESTDISPTFNLNSVGNYKIKLIAYKSSIPDTSNSLNVRVVNLQTALITRHPKSPQLICESNSTANLNFIAQGDNLSFQWQVDMADGKGFRDTVDFTFGNSTNGMGMTITNPKPIHTDYKFRVIAKGQCGLPDTSDVGGFEIIKPTKFLKAPENDTICLGQTPTFEGITQGGLLEYEWKYQYWGDIYRDLDEGSIYSGVNNDTLKILQPSSVLSKIFKLNVDGFCGNIESNPVKIVIATPGRIVNQPNDISVCSDGDGYFSVGTVGAISNYHWEMNLGSGFLPLSNSSTFYGVATKKLGITNSSGLNNTEFRCIVTDFCGNLDTSSLAILSYAADIIIGPLSNDTACIPSSANFSFTTEGGANSYYVWEVDTGLNFETLLGKNSNSINLSTTVGMDNAKFRAQIHACGIVDTTNIVSLKTKIRPVFLTQPEGTKACYFDTIQLSVSAQPSDCKYDWGIYSYIEEDENFSGINSSLLTLTNINSIHNKRYYCQIEHDGCTKRSNYAVVQLNEKPRGYAGSDKIVCSDVDEVQLQSSIYQNTIGMYWTTSGTGVFSPKDSILNPIYIPSLEDKLNGKVILKTHPFTSKCNLSNEDEMTLTIDICTGINELDNKSIAVHPNPTMGNLSIDLPTNSESKFLLITNVLGDLVKKFDIQVGQNNINLKLPEPSGVYFIKLDKQINPIRVIKNN